MKTPEQIAAQIIKAATGIESNTPIGDLDASLNSDPGFDGEFVFRMFTDAIEADRAERDPNADGTLHGAAIIALKERSYHAGDTEEGWRASDAAGWIEANPDEFWDSYAGPMLDEIERDFRVQ